MNEAKRKKASWKPNMQELGIYSYSLFYRDKPRDLHIEINDFLSDGRYWLVLRLFCVYLSPLQWWNKKSKARSGTPRRILWKVLPPFNQVPFSLSPSLSSRLRILATPFWVWGPRWSRENTLHLQFQNWNPLKIPYNGVHFTHLEINKNCFKPRNFVRSIPLQIWKERA